MFAVKSVVEIEGDGTVLYFFDLMPYPNGPHHRIGFTHQFLIALQDDQTAQEGKCLVAGNEANLKLFAALVHTRKRLIAGLVHSPNLGVLFGEALCPFGKVERMVRLLANDGLYVLQQLWVAQFAAILAHNANQKPLKVRYIHSQGVDEHGELRRAFAPNGLGMCRVKLQGTDWNMIHGMLTHFLSSVVRFVAGPMFHPPSQVAQAGPVTVATL